MKVAIRVDATLAAGTGHLMRCLTLARTLRAAGAAVVFISRMGAGSCHALTREAGFELRGLGTREGGVSGSEDAAETIEALAGERPDWLVVDHYELDVEWEVCMRPYAQRILVIDDLADRTHDCDALLDQNPHDNPAERYRGRVPPRCVGWYGLAYLLLRDEFRSATTARRTGPVRKVLITFGGADAGNNTLRAMEVLAGDPETEVDVVIGSAHPSRSAVEAACAAAGMHCHARTSRMAELMASADAAISACGFTAYELVAMQVPAVLVPVSAPQAEAAAQLDRLGTAIALPLYRGELEPDRLRAAWLRLRASPQMRLGMIEAARGLIDGNGARRVAKGLARLSAA